MASFASWFKAWFLNPASSAFCSAAFAFSRAWLVAAFAASYFPTALLYFS